ncbi:MAG: hypothetical protein RL662_1801 [Bacteroidota bacterium]|jgi:copper chaperone
MNQELKFKTSINCERCVAKVKPFLDQLDAITSWSVDTDSSDKILTVSVSAVINEQIIDAIDTVGFDIEQI